MISVLSVNLLFIIFIWRLVIQNNSKSPTSRASPPPWINRKAISHEITFSILYKNVKNEAWKLFLNMKWAYCLLFYINVLILSTFLPFASNVWLYLVTILAFCMCSLNKNASCAHMYSKYTFFNSLIVLIKLYQ